LERSAANDDRPDGLPSHDLSSHGRPSLDPPADDLVELFFFAYRDFVADPDRILADYGFGRAQHRVLHFVDRRAGLTVAELLDILRITKQSLNRVLKELIDQGFVESRAGTSDRRQRHLGTTPAGRDLAQRLARLQTDRIGRALAEADPDAAAGSASAAGAASATGAASARRFLLAMIDPDGRDQVRPKDRA
jgi:DNA-binding MarR family transcriptional regulator